MSSARRLSHRWTVTINTDGFWVCVVIRFNQANVSRRVAKFKTRSQKSTRWRLLLFCITFIWILSHAGMVWVLYGRITWGIPPGTTAPFNLQVGHCKHKGKVRHFFCYYKAVLPFFFTSRWIDLQLNIEIVQIPKIIHLNSRRKATTVLQ